MSSEVNNNSFEKKTINLKEELGKYLIHWKWFILSVIIFLSAGVFFLRYAQVKYKSNVTIIFKSEKDTGLGGLIPFSDLGMSASSNLKDNQIEILQSRSLLESTIKYLKLNKSYTKKGIVKESEVYGEDCPIVLDFLKEDKKYFKLDTTFNIVGVSKNKFIISDEENNNKKEHTYGEVIKSEIGDFTVIKNSNFLSQETNPNEFNVGFKIRPLNKVISNYKKILKVSSVSKTTDIVNLSIIGVIKSKSEDFLRTIVEIYNSNAMEDERLISRKTISFIDNRLELITSELKNLEKGTEKFKKDNNVTDILSQANIYLNSANNYESLLVESQTDLLVIDQMIELLKNNSEKELIPTGIIPSDANAQSLITEYNKLLLDRNRIVDNSSTKNPSVLILDQKLNALKLSVKESLSSLKQSIAIKIDNIKKQGGLIDNRITKIPQQERQYREIIRMQEIKETLFLFLIQKREDAAILMEITEPISRIIDAPYTIEKAVYPKKGLTLIGALLLAIALPGFLIYIYDLLDSKVKTRAEVESLVPGIPYLGDVPRLNNDDGVIMPESRSSAAEALRMIRTNADFLLSKVDKNRAKVIFASSTIPGEGKTFVSYNLAKTIAFTGKKVLLIGFDIRNPRLDDYVDLPSVGLTNYLMNDSIELSSIVVNHPELKSMDLIPAGVIPPNPSELLLSDKLSDLFDDLKSEYDYIVVDTAPLSLVTDTFLISKYADLFIYVIRYNYLERNMLELTKNVYNEKKLSNMAFVINDTVNAKSYGYGVYSHKKYNRPWYKKLFS